MASRLHDGVLTGQDQPAGWFFHGRARGRAGLRLVAVLAALCATVQAAQAFLPADQAFSLVLRRPAADLAELHYTIAPGYYLYRAPLAVQAEGALAGAPRVPPGVVRYDENFQKNVETYHGTLVVGVPLADVQPDATLLVQSQGCAEAGLCYPVSVTRVRLPAVGDVIRPDPPAEARGGLGLAAGAGGAASTSVAAGSGEPAGPAANAGAHAGTARVAAFAGAAAGAGLVALLAGGWWLRRRRAARASAQKGMR